MAKRIFFTVTNDLTYDQRMQRICTSLSKAGYDVTLVGFLRPTSIPLKKEIFKQKRFRLFFLKGGLFYAEYNIRLLIYFLFKKMDAICAIDLDTILPCLTISKWKKIPRIYDAHELFTELKEVVSRPDVKRKWDKIERHAVPQFKYGYTVAETIAEELNKKYKAHYQVIRNVTELKENAGLDKPRDFILYQGAVNQGRCFEYIIPAMKEVNSRLVICGDGNFMSRLKQLIIENNVQNKVELKGMMTPDELWRISLEAKIGLTIIENIGMNQYYSLPNKVFDYIHAGIPQIAMNYPEYARVNEQFEIAVLLNQHSPEIIAHTINNLLLNDVLYSRLRNNCLQARQHLNWQQEEKKLLEFYQTIFKQ